MRWALRPLFAGMLILATVSQAQEDDSLSQELDRLTKLAEQPLYERALRWICAPSRREVCSKNGCTGNPAAVTVKLDFRESTYSRCDEKGCDKYGLEFTSGGIFTTCSPHGSDAVMKVVNDGSEYMEVTTLFLAAHVNFGTCRPDTD